MNTGRNMIAWATAVNSWLSGRINSGVSVRASAAHRGRRRVAHRKTLKAIRAQRNQYMFSLETTAAI